MINWKSFGCGNLIVVTQESEYLKFKIEADRNGVREDDIVYEKDHIAFGIPIMFVSCRLSLLNNLCTSYDEYNVIENIKTNVAVEIVYYNADNIEDFILKSVKAYITILENRISNDTWNLEELLDWTNKRPI